MVVGVRRVFMVVLGIVRLACSVVEEETAVVALLEDSVRVVPTPLDLLHQDRALDLGQRQHLRMVIYPLNMLVRELPHLHLPVGRKVRREECRPFPLSFIWLCTWLFFR